MIRRVVAQTKIELLLTLRRGESLLVIAGIPVGVLLFFSTVDVLPYSGADRGTSAVDFLVPGVLALAVISSAMTSLGIATGFERHAGVLRRLGTTPLGREGLLAAKIVSLSAIVAMQVVLISAVGYGLGWRPTGSVGIAIGSLALGTLAFAGLGFFLAGRLRAETNLATANGLFLIFLLVGGIVVPVARLPQALRALARVLPAEPLATSVRAALLGTNVPTRALITLIAWAAATCLLAVATFRWD